MADDPNAEILSRLASIEEYIEERKRQQLSYPLDDASKATIDYVKGEGGGTTAKTQTYTDNVGNTITGPKAYASTWLLRLPDGTLIEVPSLR